MDKLNIIKQLLAKIGMPASQQSELCALTILAMAKIKKEDKFSNATNNWLRIHDVIAFINENYSKTYAENSRETFRKQAMHHFRTGALVEDNGKPTNSPKYCYRLTNEFLLVIKDLSDTDGIQMSNTSLSSFISNHEKLIDIYSSKKTMKKLPVRINNQEFTFSPGSHNKLQKAILEEFAPRFAPNSQCLYVGDTTKKNLVKDDKSMKDLGFNFTLHEKLPDIVLYRADKKWLYFIEATDTVGPMSEERKRDIDNMTENVDLGKIYITAFLTFDKYRKFSNQLAWETEVWIAEMPDHMIHLNGDKFIGPR